MNRKPFFCLVFVVVASCAPQVARVDPSTQVDLSGSWNDTDSRAVADQLISQLASSQRYKDYAVSKVSRPTIIVGAVRNKTAEHIDANNYIKKLEAAMQEKAQAE